MSSAGGAGGVRGCEWSVVWRAEGESEGGGGEVEGVEVFVWGLGGDGCAVGACGVVGEGVGGLMVRRWENWVEGIPGRYEYLELMVHGFSERLGVW